MIHIRNYLGGKGAGVNMKTMFLLGIIIWMQMSFTLQAVKNLSAHPTYLRFGLFCKIFLGDFWVYVGITSFDQRTSKIYGNRQFWRFVLKLKFEVKNDTKQLLKSPECPFGGNQLSGGVPKLFLSFQSLFKLPTISLT